MDCGMQGFPVHHQLLELAQTHIYSASDAIQPSNPLSPPSPPAFNLFQKKERIIFKERNRDKTRVDILEHSEHKIQLLRHK